MELTNEQKAIVNYDLNDTDVLKVIAFAGTGKTTTLFEYTKARPHINFLYIAFNKSVQLEAERKFPRNVYRKLDVFVSGPELIWIWLKRKFKKVGERGALLFTNHAF